MISLYDILEAANGQLFGEASAQLFADICVDSRLATDNVLYVALQSDRTDDIQEAIAKGATGLLCVNPPAIVPDHVSVVLVRDATDALMAWARYILQRMSTPVIGVTGTSGKSLSAAAIAHVLSTRYRVHYRDCPYTGRLSLPYAIAKLSPDHDLIVLNLDTTNTGDMSSMLDAAQPTIGVITRLNFDHVGYFDTPQHASNEYAQFIAALPHDGLCVLNFDDDRIQQLPLETPAKIVTVGAERFGADLMAYNIVTGLTGTGFDLRYQDQRYLGRWTPLLGKHQLYGLMNALVIGDHYGIPLEDGLRALREFEALSGQMRPLRGINGAVLIDDSHSATPETMLDALAWLTAVCDDDEHHRAIFVMGDMDNLGAHHHRGHRLVGKVATQTDRFVTYGTDAAISARAAQDNGMDAQHIHITFSASDAAEYLSKTINLTADDVVLMKCGALARMDTLIHALLENPEDTAHITHPNAILEVSPAQSLTRPSWVDIDLEALAHNVRRLKDMVGEKVTLTAVVKANAYGCGAVSVARTALLNGAEYLAVASLSEALELRDAGITAPILVLSYVAPQAVRHAIRHGITVTLYDLDLARAYERVARQMDTRLKAHVKIDTGMGRLGTTYENTMPLFRHLIAMPMIEIEGVYTHLAAADMDPEFTQEQVKIFRNHLTPLRAAGLNFRYIHAANSAATLLTPDYHFNMVRTGIAMYGVSPSESVQVPEDFRELMSWRTIVAHVKTLPAGHNIGYSLAYTAPQEMRIAVIPVGYSDGLRRMPETWGGALVHGQFAPIVGRVSMEKTALDISHIPNVAIGDEVVLIGKQGDAQITAEAIATRLGTITHEVLCSVLARVPR